MHQHNLNLNPPSKFHFSSFHLIFNIVHIAQETDQLEYIIPEESSLEQHLQVTDTTFIDFVRYLLSINPKRRPTARQALRHPWLSYVY